MRLSLREPIQLGVGGPPCIHQPPFLRRQPMFNRRASDGSEFTRKYSMGMPLIDQFTTALAPGERRAVVAARGRIPFTPPGVYDRERLEEYSRSIKPSLRRHILEQHNYRCAICLCDLRFVPHHIDHIKPFARHGPTVRENLQPLCAPCNLAKGVRE